MTNRSNKSTKTNAVQPSNRKHVVEVAAQLFLRGGYAHTSMDDVMRESRVSKSNIYYHFKSKEELLLAVVEYWAHTYESALTALLEQPHRTVEERTLVFLAALADGFAVRNCQGGCPFVSLYVQSPEQASQVKARISRFFAELKPNLEKLFRQGIDAGEFRPDLEAAAVSMLFLTALEGALVLAETISDLSIIQQTGRSFFKMLR